MAAGRLTTSWPLQSHIQSAPSLLHQWCEIGIFGVIDELTGVALLGLGLGLNDNDEFVAALLGLGLDNNDNFVDYIMSKIAL